MNVKLYMNETDIKEMYVYHILLFVQNPSKGIIKFRGEKYELRILEFNLLY